MSHFDQYPLSYLPQQYRYGDAEIKEEQLAQSLLNYTFDTMYSNNQSDLKYDAFRSISQNSFRQTHSDQAPSLHSPASGPSLASPSSSTVGSPSLNHAMPVSQSMYPHEYVLGPAIVDDSYSFAYESGHFDHESAFRQTKFGVPFVDPVLVSDSRTPYVPINYGTYSAAQQPQYSPAPSPAPSTHSYHSFSNPVTVENFSTQHAAMRRQSSMSSLKSGGSPRSVYSLDDDAQKDKCPFPDCGRTFKDLKAHLLTHGSERPEKCPIVSCEYHKKGFARKYDKNRHTLTHYRGTMVCGFCPGSGSAAEKSFNRADVFKRHLTSVHNVEQTAPNSRKRSPSKAPKLSSYCPDATGKCSTCGATFSNAQEFYEHLDDCVLKVVQQEDPIEAVNARRMKEVLDDSDVQATFERNNIKSEENSVNLDEFDEEEEEDEDDEEEIEVNERSGRGVIKTTRVTSNRPIIGGNISKKTSKKGLTWSRGGGSIIGKSRKRRKDYPPSWGMAVDKMNMKKRVVCVYDGQRRLLKDDMMMYNEYEVRMPLLSGNHYVTDLDIETMKRSTAFHHATLEEKGPWIQDHEYLNLSD